MIANKLLFLICISASLCGCSKDGPPEQYSLSVDILNLGVQAIYSELNIWNCYSNDTIPNYQCEEPFSYLADSLIIVNQIFDIDLPEAHYKEYCFPAIIDSTAWEKISYYRKVNLSPLKKIEKKTLDPYTKFFLIHQPWICGDKLFIHISMHGSNVFSGHLLIFTRSIEGKYILDRIDLMGYS